jgi:hypothetical protein
MRLSQRMRYNSILLRATFYIEIIPKRLRIMYVINLLQHPSININAQLINWERLNQFPQVRRKETI